MATINQVEVANTTYNLEDSTKLPLTGGTLTGDVIVTQDHGFYTVQSQLTDRTVPESTITGKGYVLRDSTNTALGWLGRITNRFWTDGKQGVLFESHTRINSTDHYTNLVLGHNSDGTSYVYTNSPEAWRKGLALDCFDTNRSGVGTLGTGGSFYFGNGNQIGSTGTVYGMLSATNGGTIYLANATSGSWDDTSDTATKIQWNFNGAVTNPYLRYRLAKYESNTITWGDWISPYWHTQTSRTQNTVLAAPSTADGKAQFRALDSTDIPNLAASKITSGYFSVARGGTGRNTLTDNAILAGNVTSAINMIATKSGALYATAANGAAAFGTLPIAQGGTGKTSAADAWSALGGGSIGKKDSLAASDIPSLAASKITSGTFDAARLPAASTSAQGAMSAADKTKLNRYATADVSSTNGMTVTFTAPNGCYIRFTYNPTTGNLAANCRDSNNNTTSIKSFLSFS